MATKKTAETAKQVAARLLRALGREMAITTCWNMVAMESTLRAKVRYTEAARILEAGAKRGAK
jgi:hypothetical protein